MDAAMRECTKMDATRVTVKFIGSVSQLPAKADVGDVVVCGSDTYLYDDGKWIRISEGMMEDSKESLKKTKCDNKESLLKAKCDNCGAGLIRIGSRMHCEYCESDFYF